MELCPNCAAPATGKFCVQCGLPLPAAEKPQQRRRRWPWLVGVGVLVLAVVVGAGVWFFRDRPGPADTAFLSYGIVPDQPQAPTVRWSIRPSEMREACSQGDPTTFCTIDHRWVGSGLVQVWTSDYATNDTEQVTWFVDAQTGQTRWRSNENYLACQTLENEQLLCFTETDAVSLDPSNGEQNWRTELGESDQFWSWRETESALYFAPFVDEEEDGSVTIPVVKVSLDGEREWTAQVRGESAGLVVPLISDDSLGFPLRKDGKWQTVDLASGTVQEVDEFEGDTWRGTYTFTADGSTLFNGVDTREADLISPYAADQAAGMPLTLISGGFYTSDNSTLSVRDPDDPQQELLSRPNAAPLAYCADVLVLHEHFADQDPNSNIVAVDPATGEELWQSPGNNTGSWPPAVWCDSERLITAKDGQLMALDLKTGQARWQVPVETDSANSRGGALVTATRTGADAAVQGWG